MNLSKRFFGIVVLTAIISFSFVSSSAAQTVFDAHSHPITALDFSVDGTRLVSASEDGSVRVWDLVKRNPLGKLTEHSGPVRTVAVSPNGKGMASGGEDNSVKVWSMASFRCLRSFTPPAVQKSFIQEMLETTDLKSRPGVFAVDFSGDGRYVASSHGDFSTIIWDIKTGSFKKFGGGTKGEATGDGHTRPVLSIALSPDGTLLASGEEETSHKDVFGKTSTWAGIIVWNPTTGAVIKNIDAKRSVVFLAFAPNSRELISGLATGEIVVWNPLANKVLRSFRHGNELRTAKLAKNGSRLVSIGVNLAKVWDVTTGAHKTFKGNLDWVLTAAGISSDGQRIALGTSDGRIKVMEVGAIEETIWEETPAGEKKAAEPGKKAPSVEKIWDD